MRSFIAIAALVASISAFAEAQVPNVFEDGTPATAADVNENFQYVLENASGGCSATQQDNSVLIECADGTSGVIAGAGNVYVLPDATQGEVPDITLPTGDILVVDANDQPLANFYGGVIANGYRVWFDGTDSACLLNIKTNESVLLVDCVRKPYVYYLEDDCSGVPLGSDHDRNALFFVDSGYRMYPKEVESTVTLVHSRRGHSYLQAISNGNCEEVESSIPAAPLVQYYPAPEILNAAYPVRLKQFP